MKGLLLLLFDAIEILSIVDLTSADAYSSLLGFNSLFVIDSESCFLMMLLSKMELPNITSVGPGMRAASNLACCALLLELYICKEISRDMKLYEIAVISY